MNENKATIHDIVKQVSNITNELVQLALPAPTQFSYASPDVEARVKKFNECVYLLLCLTDINS
jgi:hypothetical protein